MRVVGYLRGPKPDGLDCESPLQVVCRSCDLRDLWQCQNHRESKCRPCSTRYRRRVRAVAESGLQLHASGYRYFLTLTAPGDRQHSYAGGRLICPCTPAGGVDLAEWNATHGKRWNHFRTRMSQLDPSFSYFRGCEVQDGKRKGDGGPGRNALHDHSMVSIDTPLDLATVRRIAIECGFGHSVDLAPVQPGSKREAYYVAKYVTKATDSRDAVPWSKEKIDYETGEVTLSTKAAYRTWSKSRSWGTTMAKVRAEGAAYARMKAAQRAAEPLSPLTVTPEPLTEAAHSP